MEARFPYSRRSYCRGLYELYELRDQLPLIAAHFLMAGARAPVPAHPAPLLSDSSSASAMTTGRDYTLYIPEDYSPNRPLPLIVALYENPQVRVADEPGVS